MTYAIMSLISLGTHDLKINTEYLLYIWIFDLISTICLNVRVYKTNWVAMIISLFS